MSLSKSPIEIAPPARKPASLADLTFGQVIALLDIHGGPVAHHTIGALLEAAPRDFQRGRPDDRCSVTMLGLAVLTPAGMRLTDVGGAWLHTIMGGAA